MTADLVALDRSRRLPREAVLVHGAPGVACGRCCGDPPIDLTTRQFDLIELFVRYTGEVMSTSASRSRSRPSRHVIYCSGESIFGVLGPADPIVSGACPIPASSPRPRRSGAGGRALSPR